MIPNVQFFTAENMNVFFGNVRALLYMVMPLLVVATAASLMGYFIVVIRNAFSNNRQSNDHDDDYDDDRYD